MRIEFDQDADMQILTAQKVMGGLSDDSEQGFLRAFNENRCIWPVHSLSVLGLVRGGSMGLPTFLAMLQARLVRLDAVG